MLILFVNTQWLQQCSEATQVIIHFDSTPAFAEKPLWDLPKNGSYHKASTTEQKHRGTGMVKNSVPTSTAQDTVPQKSWKICEWGSSYPRRNIRWKLN